MSGKQSFYTCTGDIRTCTTQCLQGQYFRLILSGRTKQECGGAVGIVGMWSPLLILAWRLCHSEISIYCLKLKGLSDDAGHRTATTLHMSSVPRFLSCSPPLTIHTFYSWVREALTHVHSNQRLLHGSWPELVTCGHLIQGTHRARAALKVFKLLLIT